MRALLVEPGPGYSVADVAAGWVKGLTACGVELYKYEFAHRIWAWTHAKVPKNGRYVEAMRTEDAIEAALEPLGTFIYELWPDVVIFVSGFWVKTAALDTIRARGQKVVLLCTESPYEDDRQLELAAHADVTLINDPTNLDRFRAVCPIVRYCAHSYDPDVHRPGPADPEKRSDLCIVGTGYPSRVAWLRDADLRRIDVALVGNWREGREGRHPLRKHLRDACIDNPVTVDWYRSTRASLNLYRTEADRPEFSAGWSMGPREIELAATGTFFLTQPRGENRQVLPMVPTITDPEEFRPAYDWWMAHDARRDDVVQRAREAVAQWTFTDRARSFLHILEQQHVLA